MTPTLGSGGDWELVVDPDWPGFAGHFPGNPVLPAAELIDLVGQTLDVGSAELILGRFLVPVSPGDHLHWQGDGHQDEQRSLRTRVRCGDVVVAELRWRR